MSAAATHDEMVAAYNAQQAEITRWTPGSDVWTGALAARFRDNPRRALDPVLEAVAGYLRPEDRLVDVGGGAGRLALPMALRCREVVVVDPSEGMREQFESIRGEAGIENARYVQSDWLESAPIEGDVALVAHVTYFVSEIERFIAKLVAAAARRVIIIVNSLPPPNSNADAFELLHGIPLARVPGHAVLLPVLWERGVLPDVRVLPALAGPTTVLTSREQAVESLSVMAGILGASAERVRELGETHFGTLFTPAEGGWVRASSAGAQAVLITWET